MKLLVERRRKLDEEIAHKKVRAEKRSYYVTVLEDRMEKRRAEARDAAEAWEKVEDVRFKRELARDARRTQMECERWGEQQQAAAAEQTRKRVDKDESVRKYWEGHRQRCKDKAVRQRHQRELDAKRRDKIAVKMEARAKRIKHEQWLKELKPQMKLGISYCPGRPTRRTRALTPRRSSTPRRATTGCAPATISSKTSRTTSTSCSSSRRSSATRWRSRS